MYSEKITAQPDLNFKHYRLITYIIMPPIPKQFIICESFTLTTRFFVVVDSNTRGAADLKINQVQMNPDSGLNDKTLISNQPKQLTSTSRNR